MATWAPSRHILAICWYVAGGNHRCNVGSWGWWKCRWSTGLQFWNALSQTANTNTPSWPTTAHAWPWMQMNAHECIWMPMNYYECPWIPMNSHECRSLHINAYLDLGVKFVISAKFVDPAMCLMYMNAHEFSWMPMNPHELSWTPIIAHQCLPRLGCEIRNIC